MVSKLIVAVSSLLMLAFALLSAVGSPPSYFVDGPNFWTQLEPMMLPALLCGALLAVLAVIASPISVRVAALLCASAACCTGVGDAIAWGLDAEVTGLRPLLLPLATLVIPVLGALAGCRMSKPARVGETHVHETG